MSFEFQQFEFGEHCPNIEEAIAAKTEIVDYFVNRLLRNSTVIAMNKAASARHHFPKEKLAAAIEQRLVRSEILFCPFKERECADTAQCGLLRGGGLL